MAWAIFSTFSWQIHENRTKSRTQRDSCFTTRCDPMGEVILVEGPIYSVVGSSAPQWKPTCISIVLCSLRISWSLALRVGESPIYPSLFYPFHTHAPKREVLSETLKVSDDAHVDVLNTEYARGCDSCAYTVKNRWAMPVWTRRSRQLDKIWVRKLACRFL